MSFYLLDTNHLSALQRSGDQGDVLRSRLDRLPTGQIGTAIVCVEEEFRGWMAYLASLRSMEAQVAGYARLEALLGGFGAMPILPFDNAALTVFQSLWLHRIRVSTMDLKIAAIAIVHDALLLTRNSSDFARIAEQDSRLRFADWTVRSE